jgi:hypothetical protein
MKRALSYTVAILNATHIFPNYSASLLFAMAKQFFAQERHLLSYQLA